MSENDKLNRPQWCECSDRMSGGIPCPPGTCPNAKSKLPTLSRREVLSTKELFSSLLGSFVEPLFDSFDTFDPIDDTSFSYNEDGSLNITVELPGVKQEDISVSILSPDGVSPDGSKYMVKVSGSIRTKDSRRTIIESFTIPEGYRLEPTRTLLNGVLILTFPLLDPKKK